MFSGAKNEVHLSQVIDEMQIADDEMQIADDQMSEQHYLGQKASGLVR